MGAGSAAGGRNSDPADNRSHNRQPLAQANRMAAADAILIFVIATVSVPGIGAALLRGLETRQPYPTRRDVQTQRGELSARCGGGPQR